MKNINSETRERKSHAFSIQEIHGGEHASRRVVIGLSGGVDSAVAAALLMEEGYEVLAVTEILSGYEITEDAETVAKKLGIEHCILDLREVFERQVIRPFVQAYLAGRTPNPCVLCNRTMKWQGLLDYADKHNAAFIATGHYAQVENGRIKAAGEKDQSYALYQIDEAKLRRTLFPLAGLTKEEVRAYALSHGLDVAEKPDSMEICFIPDHDYAAFIRRYIEAHPDVIPAGEHPENPMHAEPAQIPGTIPGNFVDRDGRVLGTHKGLIHYTVGQRKGLGISAPEPLYVLELRPHTNEVLLGPDEQTRATIVTAKDLYLPDLLPGRARGRIRYNHKGAPCKVKREGDCLVCEFDTPVRAVTPGQALVLYDGDLLLGGGTIISGVKNT